MFLPVADGQAAVGMSVRPVPERHWRSYGNDPLPSPQEALAEPFNAFPSWFLRIECDVCGKAAGSGLVRRIVLREG